MSSREYLLIADAVAPLASGPSAVAAAGLGRALAASGRKATILSLAQPDVAAAQVPGLARRLRTVPTSVGDRSLELTLYEGKATLSDARLLVLGAPPLGRAETAALLASAVRALGQDGLRAPDHTIRWGETAAGALSATAASIRLFALPTGRLGPPLTEEESRVLAPLSLGDEAASRSLVALGALAANAIFAPSPSAARANENDPVLATRASDEPFVAVRFGCDDPPHDPATDSALPASYSASALGGKAECRRALARRCSLALGPRTLLLTRRHAPPRRGATPEAIPRRRRASGALRRGHRHRAAHGDRGPRRAGRSACSRSSTPAASRSCPAPSPATTAPRAPPPTPSCWATTTTWRAVPPASRSIYGTFLLPIAARHRREPGLPRPDLDERSATGHALALRPRRHPFEIESAVRRAIAVRADGDTWTALVRSLLASAPRWAQTAAAVEEIAAQYA